MAYSYLELAYEVLRAAPRPLTYREIWDSAKDSGLALKVNARSKTPHQSLGSYLYVDVRDNPDSKFLKTGQYPARFSLKEQGAEQAVKAIESLEAQQPKPSATSTTYTERQLHPLLVRFAYANPGFNRGRAIITKTIFHESSQKKGYNEWIHPDIVGFYSPIKDWTPEVFEFNRLTEMNSIQLYSFELKRDLNKSNYRQSYFQAVSNSSWAHEGYLVAAEITDNDEDLLAEFDRLTCSFGIGIIRLDVKDFDSSEVLYPARPKSNLDWRTINKLCDQNTDFRYFLTNVKNNFNSREIIPSKYDLVLPDITKYILEELKIESPSAGIE